MKSPLDGLYHRFLGLPPEAAKLWVGQLNLYYSAHAQKAATEDRYGKVPLFSSVLFEEGDVIEVEVKDGRVIKAVLRVPYDDHRDLVFAILRPDGVAAYVKTVWFNLASDAHKTLRRELYRRPQ